MSERNKEQVYDDDINPLMAQIIAICQEHNIAMLASFAIPTPNDPGLRCTTKILTDESLVGVERADDFRAASSMLVSGFVSFTTRMRT